MQRTKSLQAWHLVNNQAMYVDYWIGVSTKRDLMAIETSSILPSFRHKEYSSSRIFERLVTATNPKRINFKGQVIIIFSNDQKLLKVDH